MRRIDSQTLATSDGRCEIWGSSRTKAYVVMDVEAMRAVMIHKTVIWSRLYEARDALVAYLNGDPWAKLFPEP